MKRFFFSFIFVISILWLMPMLVKAESTYPTYQEFSSYFNSIYDEEITQDLYNNITTMWNVHPDYVLYTCTRDYIFSSNALCFYIGSSSRGITVSGNTVNIIGGSYCFRYKNSPYQYSSVSNNYTAYIGGDYNGMYFGTKQEFMETWNAIDYDDLIFDPSIPVPKYTSLYGILPLWNLGGSVTPQFPIQTFFTSMPQYKIEVQVRYYSPSKITFNGSRRSALSEDWNINYNYDSLMPSEWYPLVTMQDDIQNDELALVDSDYYYSWNNFITGYDSELIEYVLDPVFISASANTSIKAYAETEYAKMRNIGGCYGNQFEIMARNYYINNGNVFVGNWFHWNSLTPESGTAEYSNDAVQDNTVNGVQNVVNSNDLPTGNSLTNIGEPTGNAYNPSNNIIINTNVPNYPDYPTIADYNRDNLLVGFIKTAKSMPQYLGEFNDFLKMAFSFIDPSVWAVISLGFGASIVIMIIKVL